MPGLKSRIAVFANTAGASNSAAILITNGGTYLWSVEATFGGATIDLRLLGPGGTNYILIPNTAMTVAGMVAVDLPSGCTVRGTVTGAGGTAQFANLDFIG